MAPNNQQQQAAAAAAAAAVRLPYFHADSPQCWFDNLDSQFATANITLSITRFHWAVAKLPFSLTPTIRPLTHDPTAVADPYKKLKDLLLESYGSEPTSGWVTLCAAVRPGPLCSGTT
jgi:hypothetical protein